MTYLCSQMQTSTLSIFVNLRLKIQGQMGPRPDNKLAILRVEFKQDTVEEVVELKDIISSQGENLLDSVDDGQVHGDFLFVQNKGQAVICNFIDTQTRILSGEKLIDISDTCDKVKILTNKNIYEFNRE